MPFVRRLSSPLILALAGAAGLAAAPPTFRIFLDPGHGGKPENQSRRGGAHWDPLQGKFLNYYRYGSEFRAKKKDGGYVISEQGQVLKLAKMVRERLQWTHSDEGWGRFQSLLSEFGGVLPPFRRVRFDVQLAREHDYTTHPDAGRRDVNKHFRIFDGPASFPHKPGGKMIPGRLSKSAMFSPHFQVSLHIDGSTNNWQRGMSALFVPGPKHLEKARMVALGKAEAKTIDPLVKRYWSYRGGYRTKVGWMLNDMWTYYTGFGADQSGKKLREKGYIGQRWQHLDWSYADPVEASPRKSLKEFPPGAFFAREAGRFEAVRRSDGPEKVGGDNLYAGQELLRFIRYAWWREYQGGGKAWAEDLPPKKYLPPLEKPTAADWAMPLFTNAVAPFLELGQLQNWKDRYLLSSKLEVAADGLAVGLYSLAAGLPLPPVDGVAAPRGLAIDWSRYRTEGAGTYFEASHPRNRRRLMASPPVPSGQETGAGS